MKIKSCLFLILVIFTSSCTNRNSGYQQKAINEPITAPTSSETSAYNANLGLKGDEQQAILDYHNKVRAEVNVKPLSWSEKLAQHAQTWVDNLANTGCKMQHSHDSNYGENLFMGSLGHFNVIDAAKSWESEKRYYSGDVLNSSNWQKMGHYTQMVWHNTSQLGCAKVACNNNLIVICNYNPAGNYMGQKPY